MKVEEKSTKRPDVWREMIFFTSGGVRGTKSPDVWSEMIICTSTVMCSSVLNTVKARLIPSRVIRRVSRALLIFVSRALLIYGKAVFKSNIVLFCACRYVVYDLVVRRALLIVVRALKAGSF